MMVPEYEDCSKAMLCIKDALVAVEGRWKLLILYALCSGPKRFTELKKEVQGISDKVLAQELKLLTETRLIKRTVHEDPVQVVEYTTTDHGRSLNKVLFELWQWGLSHRIENIGK